MEQHQALVFIVLEGRVVSQDAVAHLKQRFFLATFYAVLNKLTPSHPYFYPASPYQLSGYDLTTSLLTLAYCLLPCYPQTTSLPITHLAICYLFTTCMQPSAIYITIN